jgi:fluoride exporter
VTAARPRTMAATMSATPQEPPSRRLAPVLVPVPRPRRCRCRHRRGSTPARTRGPRVRLDGRELAAIFTGGFAGALGRAELVQALPSDVGRWAWATFLVNVAGAFMLGYVTTRLQERLPLSAYRRPLLGTGFCGALTTFSTMQVEILQMLDAGHVGLAVAYALSSVAAGFAAVAVATNLVRRARLTT